MKTGGKILCLFLVIGFLFLIAAEFATAQVRVNCTRGQSVQTAIDKATGPTTIVVTGTCTENLIIKKDDITLQGGTYLPADPAQNTILVQGARRILITGVTVSGGRNGVASYQGGSLTLDGSSTVSGATQNGVVASYGSSATINATNISGNATGVVASDNSAIVLTNSTISNNTGSGVIAARSSSARIGQNISGVVGGNTISGNSGSGVVISRGSNGLIDSNTITGNGGEGISIEGSFATVTNNYISGSTKGINVNNSGGARIGITDGNQARGNTVENNSLEGIQSANGGAAYIYANTVQNNGKNTGRPGVAIYRATGRLLGKNTIRENGGNGVEVYQGALFQGVGDFNLPVEQDVITLNGYSGISGSNGATLDIRKVSVTQNSYHGITLGLRSTLRIYDSTISGNNYGIAVWEGSALSLPAPAATVTQNSTGIMCGGAEASYTGDTSGVTGNTTENISTACTGF